MRAVGAQDMLCWEYTMLSLPGGSFWGLSACISVMAINNRDVLGGHLQPGCDP